MTGPASAREALPGIGPALIHALRLRATGGYHIREAILNLARRSESAGKMAERNAPCSSASCRALFRRRTNADDDASSMIRKARSGFSQRSCANDIPSAMGIQPDLIALWRLIEMPRHSPMERRTAPRSPFRFARARKERRRYPRSRTAERNEDQPPHALRSCFRQCFEGQDQGGSPNPKSAVRPDHHCRVSEKFRDAFQGPD